jgi:hypothetical protein
MNPPIKGLSGARPLAFAGSSRHSSGRIHILGELIRTRMNCNQNCNSGFSRSSGLVVRGATEACLGRATSQAKEEAGARAPAPLPGSSPSLSGRSYRRRSLRAGTGSRFGEADRMLRDRRERPRRGARELDT